LEFLILDQFDISSRGRIQVKLDTYRIVNFHPESGTGTEPVPDPAPKTINNLEIASHSGSGAVPVPAVL
jgi:hypothetical protein